MKSLAVAALCVLSLPVYASITNYSNTDGCTLEVNDTTAQVIYTLEKAGQKEVVKFTEKDPERIEKYRGTLDPCTDLVHKLREFIK